MQVLAHRGNLALVRVNKIRPLRLGYFYCRLHGTDLDRISDSLNKIHNHIPCVCISIYFFLKSGFRHYFSVTMITIFLVIQQQVIQSLKI